MSHNKREGELITMSLSKKETVWWISLNRHLYINTIPYINTVHALSVYKPHKSQKSHTNKNNKNNRRVSYKGIRWFYSLRCHNYRKSAVH